MQQLHPPNSPHLDRLLVYKSNQRVTITFIESSKRYQCLLMRIPRLNPFQMYLDASYVWKGLEMLIFVLIALNFVVTFVLDDGLLNKDHNVLIAVPLCTFMSWLTVDGLKR